MWATYRRCGVSVPGQANAKWEANYDIQLGDAKLGLVSTSIYKTYY